jgi:hypothetical protein
MSQDPMVSRDELLAQLNGLLPAEFEELLFRAKVAAEKLSSRSAPQTSRAIEAFHYLEQRGDLALLMGLLGELRNVERRSGVEVIAIEQTAPGQSATPGLEAKPVSTPKPVYPDANVQALCDRLEDARARKATLHEAGVTTDAVAREILELRRQLRDGGQLRAGDALGDSRFLLIQPVGRGGFAVVWEAYDRTAQRHVAIKVLHAHLAGDPQRRERFFRGARVMMTLTSPAVVRVHEPRGEDEAFCYFVMELVPGGNLRNAVLEKRVEVRRCLPLILQVGEALAEAHSKQMVHRDVKPANIMLDEHGNAKLTDFDLVGAHDTTGGTRTGALGTFVYAAPECLDRPQEATARADVYGLGMTAIFCLSGRDLSMATFRDPATTVAQLDCSDPVRTVLEHAVAWEPDLRFANAATMVDALRDALDGSLQRTAAEHERSAWIAPGSAAFMRVIEHAPQEGPARTDGDEPTPVVPVHPVQIENAEREGRLRVELAAAMERQRVQAALEQQRLQQEMELRRAEVAKKRPTWMVAVTCVALLLTVVLVVVAAQRIRAADEANAKAEADRKAALEAQAIAKEAQDRVEKLSRDVKEQDKRLDAAQDALRVAQTDADRRAAQAELDRLRQQKFEMEKRIQAARDAAAAAERAKKAEAPERKDPPPDVDKARDAAVHSVRGGVDESPPPE